MVIYIDTLVFTNIIVDYLLLELTAKISKRPYKLSRLVISSVIGGFSSLYIFVEAPLLLDILYQFATAIIMLFILNGKCRLKPFIHSLSVFLILSFSLNGIVNYLSKSVNGDIFVSDGTVFYLNISPTFLIFATVVIYLAVLLIKRFADRKNKISSATLSLVAGGTTSELNAIVDSGNSVCDPFGSSQVFIINKEEFDRLEKALDDKEASVRGRVIPIKTVSERKLLNAIRCDFAVISDNGKNLEYQKPIAACATEKIDDGYDAIIPYTAIYRND